MKKKTPCIFGESNEIVNSSDYSDFQNPGESVNYDEFGDPSERYNICKYCDFGEFCHFVELWNF